MKKISKWTIQELHDLFEKIPPNNTNCPKCPFKAECDEYEKEFNGDLLCDSVSYICRIDNDLIQQMRQWKTNFSFLVAIIINIYYKYGSNF